MSHSNVLFEKVPVQVPNRNTFDISCQRIGTGKVGTLYPVLWQLLMPNTTISVGQRSHVQLPAFAVNTYGKISYKMEAFFVPFRSLMGRAYEDYFMWNTGAATQYDPAGITKRYLPLVTVPNTTAVLAPGGLTDYLVGLPTLAEAGEDNSTFYVNGLRYLAYHRIYDEFYRPKNYETPLFSRGAASGSTQPAYALDLDYTSQVYWTTTSTFANGDGLFGLHQRAYSKDYFTNSYLNQNGGATQMQVSVTPSAVVGSVTSQGSAHTSFYVFDNGQVGTSTSTTAVSNSPVLSQIGYFTVSQLRASNALQQFAEAQSYAGGDFAQAQLAAYGVTPPNAALNRPIFLGQNVIDVYSNTVYNQTADTSGAVTTPYQGNLGNKASDRSGANAGRLVDNFTCKEFGYLFVIGSLVPHAYYGTVLDHETAYINATGNTGFSDLFPIPQLAGIGNQPIYMSEISADLSANVYAKDKVYAWTERYSQEKFNNDQVFGLMHDGQDMSSFAIKRSFTGNQYPSSVAKIKSSDLDDVTAVTSALSNYGYSFDIDFQIVGTKPLPAYTIPTLGDMKDTHKVSVDKGGKRL